MSLHKNAHPEYFWRIFLLLVGLLFALGYSKQVNLPEVLGIGGGFDEFGYNYTARLFQGPADGVDRTLDGNVWGDPTYANDRLVMKWSKAWDDARFSGAQWTCDAWEDNEWNGKVKNGSGETWHYKVSWVGPELQTSSCWREGGYPIWSEFEVTFSQGTVANQHLWDVLARPNGYGAHK